MGIIFTSGHFMQPQTTPCLYSKLGFIVLIVRCDQLPTTVSLRGGFCRRGNLPVQFSNYDST